MKLWRMMVIVALVGMMLLIASGNVLAQGSEIVDIASPAEGELVSGIIMITGSVDFEDFMKYELFLRSGDQTIWAATAYGPVINGNLARLDTRTYPDGMYQLIIRTVRTDSNYDENVGPTFIIENNLGAPLPYPEIESSLLYPPEAGALLRIRNCSGDNLEIDYHSAQSFCSADEVLIEFKDQASPVCPFVDQLLIPCEYQGTVRGIGEPEGVGYTLLAEKGKIYEMTYPGDRQIYVAEIEGDERARTDTVGLSGDDSTQMQSSEVVAVSTPETAAAGTGDVAAPTPAPPPSTDVAEDAQPMLPVSGQGRESNLSFILVASGLILLLVAGGVIAVRKRGRSVVE